MALGELSVIGYQANKELVDKDKKLSQIKRLELQKLSDQGKLAEREIC